MIRDNGDKINAVSKDISLTGAQIRISETLKKGEVIVLEMLLPQEDLETYKNQQGVEVDALVVRAERLENYIVCGLKFINMTAQKEMKIKKIFEAFGDNYLYEK